MSVEISVVVLGDAGTAKTSICRRLCNEEINFHYEATVGAELYKVTSQINGTVVVLNIWDFPGNERFLTATGAPLIACDVCCLVCDCSSGASLEHLKGWHDEYLQSSCPVGLAPPVIVVAASKCEADRSRSVTQDHLAGWCCEEQIDPSRWPNVVTQGALPQPPFVEVSARMLVGIDRLKSVLIERVLLQKTVENSLQPSSFSTSRDDIDAFNAIRKRGGIGCVILGEPDVVQDLLLGEDVDPYAATVPLERQTSFRTLQNENGLFGVWIAGTSTAGQPSMFYCLGGHVCIMTLKLGLRAFTHRIALWKEIFLRESHLRDPASVCWVVVGCRNAQYQPDSSAEAAQAANTNNCLFIDVPETPSVGFLNNCWQQIVTAVKEQRMNVIAQRAAEQSRSTLTVCQFHASGCDWTGTLSSLDTHRHVCSFAPCLCRFPQCGKQITRGSRQEHEKFCQYRPATCHFCDQPYATSLNEHLQICSKREEFESSYVACPLGHFGCTERHLQRNQLLSHLQGDISGHMQLAAAGLTSLHGKLLEQERFHREELNELRREFLEDRATLIKELEATREKVSAQAETIQDLKLELRLVWEEIAARPKSM